MKPIDNRRLTLRTRIACSLKLTQDRLGQVEERVVAQPRGIALAALGIFDDALRKLSARGLCLSVSRKRDPGLFETMPSAIERGSENHDGFRIKAIITGRGVKIPGHGT